jgi:hypothetical protein
MNAVPGGTGTAGIGHAWRRVLRALHRLKRVLPDGTGKTTTKSRVAELGSATKRTASEVNARGADAPRGELRVFPWLAEFQGRRFTPPALSISGVAPARGSEHAAKTPDARSLHFLPIRHGGHL